MAKIITIKLDGEDERKWGVVFGYLKLIKAGIPEEEVAKTCFLLGMQKWESCIQTQLDIAGLADLIKYNLTEEELKDTAEVLRRK